MPRNKTRGTSGAGHHGVGDVVNVGVFNGLVVWVEQCALGVDGVEVAAGAPGSKFNDAVIALFKAGGFGVNDGKDRLSRFAWGVAVAEIY